MPAHGASPEKAGIEFEEMLGKVTRYMSKAQFQPPCVASIAHVDLTGAKDHIPKDTTRPMGLLMDPSNV